jgi:hypothetical protein
VREARHDVFGHHERAGQSEESENDAQGALDLACPDGDDEEVDAGEELSA